MKYCKKCKIFVIPKSEKQGKGKGKVHYCPKCGENL